MELNQEGYVKIGEITIVIDGENVCNKTNVCQEWCFCFKLTADVPFKQWEKNTS